MAPGPIRRPRSNSGGANRRAKNKNCHLCGHADGNPISLNNCSDPLQHVWHFRCASRKCTPTEDGQLDCPICAGKDCCSQNKVGGRCVFVYERTPQPGVNGKISKNCDCYNDGIHCHNFREWEKKKWKREHGMAALNGDMFSTAAAPTRPSKRSATPASSAAHSLDHTAYATAPSSPEGPSGKGVEAEVPYIAPSKREFRSARLAKLAKEAEERRALMGEQENEFISDHDIDDMLTDLESEQSGYNDHSPQEVTNPGSYYVRVKLKPPRRPSNDATTTAEQQQQVTHQQEEPAPQPQQQALPPLLPPDDVPLELLDAMDQSGQWAQEYMQSPLISMTPLLNEMSGRILTPGSAAPPSGLRRQSSLGGLQRAVDKMDPDFFRDLEFLADTLQDNPTPSLPHSLVC